MNKPKPRYSRIVCGLKIVQWSKSGLWCVLDRNGYGYGYRHLSSAVRGAKRKAVTENQPDSERGPAVQQRRGAAARSGGAGYSRPIRPALSRDRAARLLALVPIDKRRRE